MLNQYEHEGATILSAASLSDYMLPLVLGLARSVKIPPGQRAAHAFVSDLIKDKTLFPEGSSRPMMEQRILRALQAPVQVGDVVLIYENTKKARMYEKTKKVVAQRTTLAAMGVGGGEVLQHQAPAPSATAAAVASHGCVARPMSAMEPMQLPAADQLRAEPRGEFGLVARVLVDDERFSKLEASVAKLWDVLVVEGVDPAAGAESRVPSLDVVALVARMDKLERYVKDQVIAIGRQVNSLIPVGNGTPIDLS